MAIMTNNDILSMIEERDKLSVYHKGEIEESKKISSRVNIVSFMKGETIERGKHAALEGLIKLLGKRDYHLCEADVELLRNYNIFAEKDTGVAVKDGESFVAISDFHGYEYPLQKISEYYVHEYDKVYILGDATDRGPSGSGKGSIDILRGIKGLCEKYPNKVVYIPGNHDEFLVGAAKGDDFYRSNLAYNGGKGTLRELKDLKNESPIEFMELVRWLENLPIQRVHKFNGKIYALAHAFFDKKLYNERPDYCLRDYLSEKNKFSKAAENVLWFRKNKGSYDREACPDAGTIMVIGHTPGNSGSRDYDLVDSKGRRVEVNCVDGGIAYDGKMIKYDGGKGSIDTVTFEHKNTSPKSPVDELKVAKNCLHNYFVKSMYTLKGAFFDESMYLFPDNVSGEEVMKVIDSYEGKCGFSYSTNDAMDRYSMYKKIFAFDFVIQNVIDKYGSLDIASQVLNGYLYGCDGVNPGDESCFSRDRDTRFFAETLGMKNMVEVLASHNCRSVEEYIETKTAVDSKGKIKVKTI